MSPRAVVWLDRDGTLVDDPGYLRDPDRLRLLPGAAAAVAALERAGATVVLVTNQSGIGRGLMTRSDVEAVHAELRRQLRMGGARLDAIELCPHPPAEQMSPPCDCRKPRPGMVERARKRLGIGPATPQVVVGDRRADLELARATGCRAVLVRTGEGQATLVSLHETGDTDLADHVAPDLAGALPWIRAQLGLAAPDGSC